MSCTVNTVTATRLDRCCANSKSQAVSAFMQPPPAAHRTSRMQISSRASRSDAVRMAVAMPADAQNVNFNGKDTIESQLRRLNAGAGYRVNKSIYPLLVEQEQFDEPKGFWANVKAAFSSPTVLHGISGGDIYVRDQANPMSASVALPKVKPQPPTISSSAVTTINGVPVEWNKRIPISQYIKQNIQKPDEVLNRAVVQGNVARQTSIMNAYQTSL